MGQYPGRVGRDETPKATVENIPDDVVTEALSLATRYVVCPDCEEQQFVPVMIGHNSSHDCRACDYEMRIVG